MPALFAHRGSTSPTVAENTLGAFELAAELGADGVELDVRRTADGALVVHHDVELPGRGPVASCLRSEVPGSVPSLEAALRLCARLGLEVNVEVKSELEGPSHDPAERCAAQSAAVCERARRSGGRIILSSFAPAALAAAREAAPALALAWLVGPPAGPRGRPWRSGLLAALRLEAVHPADALVDEAYVLEAHADELAVRVWTVDRPERLVQLAGYGVEAVITNDVAGARAALGRA